EIDPEEAVRLKPPRGTARDGDRGSVSARANGAASARHGIDRDESVLHSRPDLARSERDAFGAASAIGCCSQDEYGRDEGEGYRHESPHVPSTSPRVERVRSFPRQLETEYRKCDEHREHADGERDDPPRVLAPLERLPPHLRPEHDQPADHACDHDQHGREHRGALERELEDPDRQKHEPGGHETRQQRRPQAHEGQSSPGTILFWVDVENYSSGDDIVVEFLRIRFSFNAADFAQRVSAAAYRLGLVDDNELDEEETEDLVELTADG